MITIEKNEEKVRRNYTYVQNGKVKTTWCTTKEFLEFKRSYDDNGLTQLEEEYYNVLTKIKDSTKQIVRGLNNIAQLI